MPTLNEKIRKCAQDWVREFNAFPTNMLRKLYDCEPDDWQEETEPEEENIVYVYNDYKKGKIEKVRYSKDGSTRYTIILDNGNKRNITVENGEDPRGYFDVIYDYKFPAWGTMWAFNDALDCEWIEKKENIRQMTKCGFRIFFHREFGYFFGIDGGGYDFYEAHWIPLYKRRGIKWHLK